MRDNREETGLDIEFEADYNDVGKLQYVFATEEIPTVHSEFLQNVQMQVMIPTDKKAQMEEKLIDITKGRMKLNWDREVEYALINQDVKIF